MYKMTQKHIDKWEKRLEKEIDQIKKKLEAKKHQKNGTQYQKAGYSNTLRTLNIKKKQYDCLMKHGRLDYWSSDLEGEL